MHGAVESHRYRLRQRHRPSHRNRHPTGYSRPLSFDTDQDGTGRDEMIQIAVPLAA